jgi:hypothetical protein
LRARKQRVTVAIDLDSVPLGIDKPSLYRTAATLGTQTTHFWSPAGVSAGGEKKLSIQLTQPRQLYTVAQHTFRRPLDLSGRNFVFVTYGASPSVGSARFILDFNRRHRGSVSFSLPSGRTTRTIALTLAQAQPHATRGQLQHVVSVRVATDSRTSDGLLTLGTVGVSASTDRVGVTYPLPCGVEYAEPQAPKDVRVHAGNCTLSATVPRDAVGRHARIVAEGRVAERAGAPVLFVKTAATSYTWSVNAPENGTLVLNQGFDPHWTLTSGGTRERSTPAFSVTNSFPISRGPHNGTISLAGSSSVAQGIGLSGATLAGLLLVGFAPAPRPRRRKRRSSAREAKVRAYPFHRRSPGFWALMGGAVTIALLLPASLALGGGAAAALLVRYRFAWWHLAGAAGAIVLAAPILAAVSDAAADTAALEALMLFALALVMLGSAQRRRYRR